jgi:hypothetical protein
MKVHSFKRSRNSLPILNDAAESTSLQEKQETLSIALFKTTASTTAEDDRVSQAQLIGDHDRSKNDQDQVDVLNENALHEVKRICR